MARIKVWNGTSWDYVGNETANVVTESGTQTLTNKTISGSSNTVSNISPSQRTGGFKVGTFSTSGTGSQAITGVGFAPKFIRIGWNAGTDTSKNSHMIGVWDGTTVQMYGSNSDTTAQARWASSSNLITVKGATAGLVVVAAPTSLDADGFTINVTTHAAAQDFWYEAYA